MSERNDPGISMSSEREAEVASLRQRLEGAERELDKIFDSPNTTAPVYELRHTVDEARARLEALGVDDPASPSDAEIAEARHAAGLDGPTVDETVDPADIAEPDPNA